MADLYGNPSAPPASAGLSDNVAGGIAYLTFIPAVVFLLVAPYNQREFVRFQSFQSIFLSIASFVFGFFRYLGPVGAVIANLLGLIVFIVWIIALIQAFRGYKFVIPGIGPLAQQYASRG